MSEKIFKKGARENYTQIRGRVLASQSNGVACEVIVQTCRPDREIGDGKITDEFVEISIASKNAEQVAKMATWKENDIVNVTGSLNVMTAKKVGFCKSCGKQLFTLDRQAVSRRRPYINPATIEKLSNYSNDKDCIDYLLDSNVKPLSNQFWCAGQLKEAPKVISNSAKNLMVSFPLIVPRSRFIAEDSPEVTLDVLYINCYGANAQSAQKYLVAGSEVDVFGFLKNREYTEEITCECGKVSSIKQMTMYVDAIRLDFRADCKNDEILEREKNRKMDEFKEKFVKGEEQ